MKDRKSDIKRADGEDEVVVSEVGGVLDKKLCEGKLEGKRERLSESFFDFSQRGMRTTCAKARDKHFERSNIDTKSRDPRSVHSKAWQLHLHLSVHNLVVTR